MNYQSAKLRQALSSEYVAGTLIGAARRRFKRLLAEDPSLREEVRYWEERFSDLGIFEPVPPRELVWTEIEQRIHQAPGDVIPIVARRQQRRLMFWRLWAAMATAASVVLAVMLLRQQPDRAPFLPPKPPVVERLVQAQAYVAALRLPNEDGQWTVSVLPDSRALRVIASQRAKLREDEDYELWWLGDDGGATSLGLLPRDGAWQVLLPAHLRVKATGRVAVSLEPAGGSQAENGPSGPILLITPLVPSV